MKTETMVEALQGLLRYDELDDLARETGALKRNRKLHPIMILEGLLATSGDGNGRLAGALDYVRWTYGIEANRSAIYKRATAEFSAFTQAVCQRVLERRIASEHPEMKGRLAAFRDLWAYDSTTVRLRSGLAEVFSSGARVKDRAGVKLHGAVSLRSAAVMQMKLTEEKVADVRAIDLGKSFEDVLVLLDRGYGAHRLFASIDEGGGAYVTRLKLSSNPTVTAVRRGKPRRGSAKGMSLDEAIDAGLIKVGTVSDIDVEIRVSKDQVHAARVVGVPRTKEDGTVETWWYLTNLDRDAFPPDALAELYRMRWEVELLWKQLKSRFRLADIDSLTQHNVEMLMHVSVLAYALTAGVLDAVTTPEERQTLSLGQLATSARYIMAHLVRFLEAETNKECRELVEDLRRKVMLSAQDSNPKRTREAKRRRRLADG